MKPKLTIKQEKFCHVYLETGNATEAYREVYNTSKMKPESINRKAKELTDNVKITARMEELVKPSLDKLEINTQYVLNNIKTIGERCMKDDNKENQALKAQELLGRHLKMFTEKIEIGGGLTVKRIKKSFDGK